MASTQGNTHQQWLTFGEAHDVLWKTDFADIGITEAQGTAYSVLVTAARTKYDAMIVARQAAKTATADFYSAAQAMHDSGQALLSLIRGYAATQANPQVVYSAAQIDGPPTPVPAGAPTDCTELSAHLNNDGSVLLTWKGTLAAGQFFSVWRKMAGDTSWTQLGSIAAKAFTDTEVPEGITGGQYRVLAHRGTQKTHGCEPVGIIFGTVPMAA